MNDRTIEFNSQLGVALDSLTGSLIDLTLHQFDIESLFDEVLAESGIVEELHSGQKNAAFPSTPKSDISSFLLWGLYHIVYLCSLQDLHSTL